jgi:chloramphenicol O-acetyltransferase type A
MFEWPSATPINMDRYPRQRMYELFKGFEIPVTTRTIQLDITALWSYVKDNQYRFTPVLGFILTRAVNHVPELRHRILNEQLVEYNKVVPSYVVLSEDKQVFFSMGVFTDVFLNDYHENVAINAAAANGLEKNLGSENLGLIYITNNPWVTFTSLQFPYASPFASVPAFGIGKVYEDGNRVKAPFAIQNHHGLTDGYHIGHFIDIVSRHLQDPTLIDMPFVSKFK